MSLKNSNPFKITTPRSLTLCNPENVHKRNIDKIIHFSKNKYKKLIQRIQISNTNQTITNTPFNLYEYSSSIGYIKSLIVPTYVVAV